MSPTAQAINVLPEYVRGKAIHNTEQFPQHLERVKKFKASGNVEDLWPSSNDKFISIFEDRSSNPEHAAIYMTVIPGPLEDSGGVPGRVMGDLPLSLACLFISRRQARPSTPAEVKHWIQDGEQRRKDAQEAAKRKADVKAGRDAELAALREKADLLERISKAEATIAGAQAGGK